ncbi:contactin-associated protein 1-like [Acropora palmata]|uniref:contactin-associated protein 1-like n=1 Tax=Acropora palmata TaxID=6131 RepID=UPI003DA098A5
MEMFAAVLFCFYLDILTRIVFASVSQDFCGRVFETRVGHALVGHNMSSVLVGDEFKCQLKCLQTQPCKSFNVHFASGQANKHVCELNSQTREMKPSDFKARKGSNYYGPVQVSCVDISHEYKAKQSQLSTKTCTQIKSRNPKATSGSYIIDPDGPGGHGPFMVFCDMNDKMAVGVTVVGHSSENRTSVRGFEDRGSYTRDVSYLGGDFDAVAKLSGLVDASKNCEQFIKYECYDSVLFRSDPYGWWVSRNFEKMTYWGGATPADSLKCACGVTLPNSCAGNNGCNCDINDNKWRKDEGLLKEKSDLPVLQLRFGDTGDNGEGGYYTLGKLRCYGEE